MSFSIRPLRRLPLTYFSGFMSLITLLLLSSGLAYAEWVLVSDNDKTGMTVYMDPDTIRRKGDLVKMWQLFDFKTIQTQGGGPFLSFKSLSEFDCTEERTHQLSVTPFSGNMVSGNAGINNSGQMPWYPVAPGSVSETLWKLACGKQ